MFRPIRTVTYAAVSLAVFVCAWAVSADLPGQTTTAPATAPAAAKPTTLTAQCATEACHATLLDRKVMCQPVAQGKCVDCHKVEDVSRHLFARPASNLCVTCHKALLPNLDQARSIHAPARDDCVACHDPHGSNLKHELKQAVPVLCWSCHKDLKEAMAHSPAVHGDLGREDSCSQCHVAHFSTLPKLQKDPQPQQCLSCHDRPVQTRDGRTLTNMAALLTDNPVHHGPIRLGSCTACHQPHAGANAHLLRAPYPPEFYAPFQVDRYKLCFTCHSQELVLEPEGPGLTGFRDGQKNLHWLHVNQDKGRTCRACHEVHASRQPFHIRESTPFGPGGWMLALNYRQTATGGTCLPGCHVQRSYDRGNQPSIIPAMALLPKALALLDPEGAKPTATTAAAGGEVRGNYPVPAPPFSPKVFPCTSCHDPNVAVNTERRVLRRAHEDIQLHHDQENRWCLDCHNTYNRDVLRSAAGAPIPFAESYRLCGQCHGTEYRDWKAGLHGKRTGQWDGQRDYLLCVHCHNPHAPAFQPIKPLPPPVRPGLAGEVR